ncbi:UNVERIFIED_CONTAM: FOG: PKD repeat [Acetivibrio alkalicellulosi]
MIKRKTSILVVFVMLLTLLLPLTNATASKKSVNVTINTSLERTQISPLIYGVNQDLPGQNVTARRLGGNRLTGYNWENNASNAGDDWHHINDNFLLRSTGVPMADYDKPGSVVTTFHNQSLEQNVQHTLITLQAAGYVSADMNGYVEESEVAPSGRWKEVKFEKDAPFSLEPDLNDDYVYMDEFVNFLVNKFGDASTPTGIKAYAIDNEPCLWYHTHPLLHPQKASCAEVVEKGVALSKAVKNVDPYAQIFGPSLYGFNAYLSFQGAPDWDNLKGSYNWFVDYYLDQMKKESDKEGKRLLDVFSVHYYSEARGGGSRVTFGEDVRNIECNKARLQAPRTLWQGEYREDSWIAESWADDFRPIIPKLQESINTYYPGTKLGITEYDFGGGNHITGGIAQADVLGIYGKYGVYYATYWGDQNKNYIVAGLNLYTNYDSNGSTYGNTNVKCDVSDHTLGSAYASIVDEKDDKLHIILLNKNYDESTTFNLSVESSSKYKSGKVFGFDRTTSDITERTPITNIDNNNFTYTLPPLSAFHIILDSNDEGILFGDLNGDGKVNSVDYVLLRRYLLEITTDINLLAADLNGDNLIDSTDYTILRRYLLEIIPSLPYVNHSENESPEAAFSFSPDEITTDTRITFDASESFDPDGSISHYAWNFGDGKEGSGKIVNYMYNNPGSYEIKLVVTDNLGLTDSITKTIEVTSATGDNAKFNFEDGTLHSFNVGGDVTSEISNTSSKAFRGNRSLKWDITSTGMEEKAIANILIDGSPIVKPGETITYRVWIPSDAPIRSIQPYIMPHSIDWTFIDWNSTWGGYEYLKKDDWNEFTLLFPETSDGLLPQQIGIQCETNGAGSFTLYVDSIDW